MAFDILFQGIGRDGNARLTLEPHWWDIGDVRLRFKDRWVVTNETGSYMDEDADITLEEARALHEQYRPKLVHLIELNERDRRGQAYCDALKGFLDSLDRGRCVGCSGGVPVAQ
jgi:hypothetical protein